MFLERWPEWNAAMGGGRTGRQAPLGVGADARQFAACGLGPIATGGGYRRYGSRGEMREFLDCGCRRAAHSLKACAT